jgi:hypothetical protein
VLARGQQYWRILKLKAEGERNDAIIFDLRAKAAQVPASLDLCPIAITRSRSSPSFPIALMLTKGSPILYYAILGGEYDGYFMASPLATHLTSSRLCVWTVNEVDRVGIFGDVQGRICWQEVTFRPGQTTAGSLIPLAGTYGQVRDVSVVNTRTGKSIALVVSGNGSSYSLHDLQNGELLGQHTFVRIQETGTFSPAQVDIKDLLRIEAGQPRFAVLFSGMISGELHSQIHLAEPAGNTFRLDFESPVRIVSASHGCLFLLIKQQSGVILRVVDLSDTTRSFDYPLSR